MKKIICFLLAFTMLFALTTCKTKNTSEESTSEIVSVEDNSKESQTDTEVSVETSSETVDNETVHDSLKEQESDFEEESVVESFDENNIKFSTVKIDTGITDFTYEGVKEIQFNKLVRSYNEWEIVKDICQTEELPNYDEDFFNEKALIVIQQPLGDHRSPKEISKIYREEENLKVDMIIEYGYGSIYMVQHYLVICEISKNDVNENDSIYLNVINIKI